MQQRFKRQVGPFADKVEVHLVGLVKCLPGTELKHLKVMAQTVDVEDEIDGLIGTGHPRFPVSLKGTGLCVDLPVYAVGRIDISRRTLPLWPGMLL